MDDVQLLVKQLYSALCTIYVVISCYMHEESTCKFLQGLREVRLCLSLHNRDRLWSLLVFGSANLNFPYELHFISNQMFYHQQSQSFIHSLRKIFLSKCVYINFSFKVSIHK